MIVAEIGPEIRVRRYRSGVIDGTRVRFVVQGTDPDGPVVAGHAVSGGVRGIRGERPRGRVHGGRAVTAIVRPSES